MDKQITEEKIQEVAQKIAKEFQPEKIILFGSYAWGKPGPDSDVDLFVAKETENTRESTRAISRAIFPRFFPLDILVYTPEQIKRREKRGDFFIKDILQKGRILYAR